MDIKQIRKMVRKLNKQLRNGEVWLNEYPNPIRVFKVYGGYSGISVVDESGKYHNGDLTSFLDENNKEIVLE